MDLNLYCVSDRYIEYLRKFDYRIYDNKKKQRTHERKYVGVVITINDFNYYIPMSSPKKSDYIDFENKIIRKDTKTIIRMHDKKRLYGTLRISNIIPVPLFELKYKDVILSELRYIKSNSKKIIKYANLIYNQKIKNVDAEYLKNTVNFFLFRRETKELE